MCQMSACQLQVGVIVVIVPLWVGTIEVGGQLSIYRQDSPVKSDWFGQRLKSLNLLCKQFCSCFEMEGTLPRDGPWELPELSSFHYIRALVEIFCLPFLFLSSMSCAFISPIVHSTNVAYPGM